MKWNFCPSYVTFEQKLWIDLSLESLSQWVFSSEKKDECVFFPWKENCIGIRGDWHRYYKAVTVFDFIPKGRKSFIQTPRYWPKQADVSKKALIATCLAALNRLTLKFIAATFYKCFLIFLNFFEWIFTALSVFLTLWTNYHWGISSVPLRVDFH